MVMVSPRARLEITGTVVALAAIVALSVIAVTRPGSSSARTTPHATPHVSVSPVTLARVGGLPIAIPDRAIHDPRLLPYPFMSPTPPPDATPLDGTYLRTVDLSQIGGARIGLPYRCFRCPSYRIDAGVSTLIFNRGAFYVHHHLSGFRTMGSYVLDGETLTLFNDPTCPQTPGIYHVEQTSHGLHLSVIDDPCPYGSERGTDLTFEPWIHVSACIRRIQDLWPGEIAC
jgi:hypothetical protein